MIRAQFHAGSSIVRIPVSRPPPGACPPTSPACTVTGHEEMFEAAADNRIDEHECESVSRRMEGVKGMLQGLHLAPRAERPGELADEDPVRRRVDQRVAGDVELPDGPAESSRA